MDSQIVNPQQPPEKPQSQRAILFTGPSSSGKSTLSNCLLKELSGDFTYLGLDEHWAHFSDAYERKYPAVYEASNFKYRTYLQLFDISVLLFRKLITDYLAAHNDLIIDFILIPEYVDAKYMDDLKAKHDVFIVELTCHTTILEKRSIGLKKDPLKAMAHVQIINNSTLCYKPDLVLDTGLMSIDECLKQIKLHTKWK